MRALSDNELQEVVRRNTTARYLRLDLLERYVAGEQYVGRASWWDDDVPLLQRAPCIVYPIVQTAISSHVGMIFKKMPLITSAPDEDETAIDPDFGLDESTSTKFDAGIIQVVRHSSLLSALKRLLRDSMGCGSGVAIAAIRNGRLCVDVMSAKGCTPTFSESDPEVVVALEIKYPFVQERQDPTTGKWQKVVMLFRRVIDAQKDTTFLPIEAPTRPDAIAPRWTPDPSRTITHGLSYCPVLWYPFMGRRGATNDLDGEAIHAKLLDEVTAQDFAISQRHRAVLYTADPITYEMGVEDGEQPGEFGSDGGAYLPGHDPDENKSWSRGVRAGAMRRKRGPGRIWTYRNAEAKVGLLTLPSGAVEAVQINITDLDRILCKSLRWDPIDPKEMRSGATLSGRALEMLYTTQTNYCDDVRADFTEHAVLPLLNLLFRLLSKMKARGVRVYLPGFDVLADLLSRFEGKDIWTAPRLSVHWPPYFEPNETEQAAVVKMTIDLRTAGLLKTSTAVARIAPYYKIEHPAEYADDLDAEKAEGEAKLREAQKALADAVAGSEEPRQNEAAEANEAPTPKPDVVAKPPVGRKMRTPPVPPAPKPRKAPDLEERTLKAKRPAVVRGARTAKLAQAAA